MPPRVTSDARPERSDQFAWCSTPSTFPTPNQVIVPRGTSKRATLITTPRLPVSATWHGCTKDSGGSSAYRSSAVTAIRAAAAASSPWPRPSTTAMSTPSVTALTMWRSPDSDCPCSATVATPQWTSDCALRTRLRTGPLPFAHRDARAFPRRRDDFELIHQAARAGKTQAQTPRRGVAVLHRAGHVADPGAVIRGDDDETLASPVDDLRKPHFATLRVHQDVARDLGDRGGDHRLVAGGEPDLGGQLATRLAGLDDVGIRGDETAEIVTHGRCAHAPPGDSRYARAPAGRGRRGLLRGRAR